MTRPRVRGQVEYDRRRKQKTSDLLDRFQEIRPYVATLEDAADRLGVTFANLDKHLYRARKRGDERGNYHPLGIRRPSPKRAQMLIDAWSEAAPQGKTYVELAAEIGSTAQAIASAVYRGRLAGLDIPKRARKTHPRPRGHTVAQWRQIEEEWKFLREQGTTIDEAARRLDVSTDHLRRIP